MPSLIAVVDDHNLFRKGLIKLINLRNVDNKFRLHFEAENGIELKKKISTLGAPDIVMMDIDMPDMDGFETVEWMKENYPEVKVLIVSMLDTEEAILKMIRLGVKGYLSKNLEVEDLHEALDSIANNDVYFPGFVSKVMAENIGNVNSKGVIKSGPLAGISESERVFLEYAITDLTYVQIADKMNVSVKTIDGYRESLFKKLNVKSRTTLAVYALRNKLIK